MNNDTAKLPPPVPGKPHNNMQTFQMSPVYYHIKLSVIIVCSFVMFTNALWASVGGRLFISIALLGNLYLLTDTIKHMDSCSHLTHRIAVSIVHRNDLHRVALSLFTLIGGIINIFSRTIYVTIITLTLLHISILPLEVVLFKNMGYQCAYFNEMPLPPPIMYEENDLIDCVICIDKIKNGDMMRQLQCRHAFHMVCIDDWIQWQNSTRQYSCPVCRFAITPPQPPPSAPHLQAH